MSSLTIIVLFLIFLIFLFITTQLRRVVPTNEAHVVKNFKRIITYGKNVDGGRNGNVYLAWPEWVPVLGVSIKKIPLNIFDLQINGFKCYDSEKIPFKVDVTSFVIIVEPEIASEKIKDIDNFKNQLEINLEYIIRNVLSLRKIEDIIKSKREIKEEFFRQYSQEVKKWGVKLQNIEFMDIYDEDGVTVVLNILMRNRSQIESVAQIENAENQRIIKIFGSIEKVLEKDKELKIKEEELNKREIEITKRENILYRKMLEIKGKNGKEEKSILFS